MDFVILKVNGRDVTNSSHEDTVRFFESAQEPITIQVLRMQSNCKTEVPSGPSKTPVQKEPVKSTNLVTTSVQTDLVGFVNEDYIDNYYVFDDGVDYDDEDELEDDDMEEVEFDEILSNPNEPNQISNYKIGDDVFLRHCIEEVTLRKSTSSEKLGLTVAYNYPADRDNLEATEIYISEISRDSLAARDGRLREGDQILRVNGKDIESKEQTEKIFAQTKNPVTILVSRCLYQNSPEPFDNLPAYQNSMIELLVRHQQRQLDSQQGVDNPSDQCNEGLLWSLGNLTPPPVPSHTTLALTSANTVTTSSSTCSSQNSHSSNKDTIKSQMDRKADGVKDATKKLEDLNLRGGKSLMASRTVEAASDTEHIYETIPESDSEPIYSSPYEQCFSRSACEPSQFGNRSKSSKSSSSVEEKDSSSAYNTGESCNSNPLVLELHRADREQRGSTLVLCPSENNAATPTSCRARAEGAARVINPLVLPLSTKSPATLDDKKSMSHPHHHHYHHHHHHQHQHRHYHQHHNQISQNSLPDNRNRACSNTNNIMYTNIDNLERTMILQQQIFTQALNRKNVLNQETRVRNSKAHGKFRAPNLTQYHFIGSQQVRETTVLTTPDDKYDPRMEWKVKKRPDGTRYIARRSVRNRLLGNRTLEISEERAGQTTEDDTVSEIKLGRYWSKDERKRHIEHARQRKLRHQSIQQQQFKVRREPVNCEHIEEESSKELRKLIADTTNLQLANSNRIDDITNCGNNGKPLGLLSVTTV